MTLVLQFIFNLSEHRTRVIDDESDYFNTDGNKWLTPKQREALRAREQELRAKRFGSRREMKVTLDFAGREYSYFYVNLNLEIRAIRRPSSCGRSSEI